MHMLLFLSLSRTHTHTHTYCGAVRESMIYHILLTTQSCVDCNFVAYPVRISSGDRENW